MGTSESGELHYLYDISNVIDNQVWHPLIDHDGKGCLSSGVGVGSQWFNQCHSPRVSVINPNRYQSPAAVTSHVQYTLAVGS